MDPQVGQIINNKYRLLRLIGDGGMGSVYEAKHELLGTTVALKFLHGVLARRKGLVERFLQEAQVSARIKSSHVVSVSDVDRTPEGLAYMVMEYVEGDTLQTLYEQLYRDSKRLTYGDAFDIMMQILEGVSAAHSQGIVHRDLKPDNVMLSPDGKGGRLVKILDFGIAKLKASGEVDRGLTRPGVVMGTPEYMAPEQAFSADRVDARADVFSLGVMFFEMLAGRRPVGGDNAHAIAAQYLEGSIAKLEELQPNVAPKLAAAVHKAMGAKPEDRFDTMDAFRDAISPYAPDGPGTAASEAGAAAVAATPAVAAATPAATPAGESPVPKTVPPEGEDSGLRGPTEPDAEAADIGASKTGTAEMDALPATEAAEPINPLRAGTEPMPDGAVAAQMAMRDAQAGASGSGAAGSSGSGSTQIGEPFSPPAFSPSPPPAHSPAPAANVQGPSAYHAPAPRAAAGGGKKKKGPSIIAILAIAAGVSAAVVGGVYVAAQAGAREAEDDDPIDVSTPPPVTVVQPQPPVAQPPTPQPPFVQPPTPPVSQPPPKPFPKPQPKPTTQPPPKPTTQPPPTTTPPPPPPFVLPSSLPPIIPPGIFGTPPSQPPPTTTKPAPPPPGKKKGGGIFKKSGGVKKSTPSTSGQTTDNKPSTESTKPATKPPIKPRILRPTKKGPSASSSPGGDKPILPRLLPMKRR